MLLLLYNFCVVYNYVRERFVVFTSHDNCTNVEKTSHRHSYYYRATSRYGVCLFLALLHWESYSEDSIWQSEHVHSTYMH